MRPRSRPYASAAHAALGLPGVHTLFRETTDRLVARLARENRAARRMRIGPVPGLRRPAASLSRPLLRPRRLRAGRDRHRVERARRRRRLRGHRGQQDTSPCSRRCGSGARARICLRTEPIGAASARASPRAQPIADRVTVSDFALAGEDKDDVRLFVSCWPENDGIASLTPAPDTLARGGLRADASISVRVRTFDTWMQSARPPRIDLMKIDVEGAEAQVLSRAWPRPFPFSVRSESSARPRYRATSRSCAIGGFEHRRWTRSPAAFRTCSSSNQAVPHPLYAPSPFRRTAVSCARSIRARVCPGGCTTRSSASIRRSGIWCRTNRSRRS
jgi:FkbM family methyltransferase